MYYFARDFKLKVKRESNKKIKIQNSSLPIFLSIFKGGSLKKKLICNFIFQIFKISFKFTMCAFKFKAVLNPSHVLTIWIFIHFKLIVICPHKNLNYFFYWIQKFSD